MWVLLVTALSTPVPAVAPAEAPPCPKGRTSVVIQEGEESIRRCQDARGRPDGPTTIRDAAGHIRSIVSFQAGRPHGPVRFYSASGRLVEEGWMEAGRRSGTWRGLREDGSLRYEGGFGPRGREGRWRWWDAKGTLRRETHYREGLRDGPHQLAWPGGQRRLEMRFEAGRPAGTLVAFFEDGSLAVEGRFEAGTFHVTRSGPPPRNAVSASEPAPYLKILRRSREALAGCRAASQDASGRPPVSVEVHLWVEPTGSVVRLDVLGGPSGAAAALRCMGSVLEDLEFPPHDGRDLVELIVPLKLAAPQAR